MNANEHNQLEREQIIGPLLADRCRDLALAAHRIDDDERALRFSPLQQRHYHLDFIELLGERRRWQGVHYIVERITRRNAAFEGQKPAEGIELALAPAGDLDKILDSTKGCAQNKNRKLG